MHSRQPEIAHFCAMPEKNSAWTLHLQTSLNYYLDFHANQEIKKTAVQKLIHKNNYKYLFRGTWSHFFESYESKWIFFCDFAEFFSHSTDATADNFFFLSTKVIIWRMSDEEKLKVMLQNFKDVWVTC